METEILNNGIQLRYEKTDKFTRNNISVNFILPLDETAARSSLLAAVMKHGCEKYPDMKSLSSFLEMNYGAQASISAMKRTENMIFRFAFTFPDDIYTDGMPVTDNMLELIHEMIFNPLVNDGKFREEYVEMEKKNLIDSIHARINEKTSYANSRCISLMCKDEPYAIDELGTVEQVQALSGADIYEQYKKILSESNIVVFAFGRFEKSLIKEKIMSFPCHSSGALIKKPVRKLVRQDVTRCVENDTMTQTKAVFGFRINAESSENRAATILFNTIFSSSPTSRLFMNVREKMSLCYYCAAFIERAKGLMLVYAGIEAKNSEKAENEILNQLEKIKKRISKKEIDEAKIAAIDSLCQAADSPASLESFYLGSVVTGDDMTIETLIERIKNTTSADIRKVARSFSLDTVYILQGQERTAEE